MPKRRIWASGPWSYAFEVSFSAARNDIGRNEEALEGRGNVETRVD